MPRGTVWSQKVNKWNEWIFNQLPRQYVCVRPISILVSTGSRSSNEPFPWFELIDGIDKSVFTIFFRRCIRYMKVVWSGGSACKKLDDLMPINVTVTNSGMIACTTGIHISSSKIKFPSLPFFTWAVTDDPHCSLVTHKTPN